MKTTLITGASAGIGKALSYKFASKGHDLIITARRESELEKIKKDIEAKYPVNVTVKVCDLALEGNAEKLYNDLKDFNIEVLINNAGFGDISFPWDMNLDKADRMIDLNVKSLTKLSLLFVKEYADSDATLINVASVGGYSQFDVSVTYCATKFYVSSFTEGLASVLKTQGKKMRAKVLAPGATESEFVIRASEDAGINDGESLFNPEAYITAEKLSDYTYELYESDKVVGIVNDKNFELKAPVYPMFNLADLDNQLKR